jgi:hypothetical protein
LDGHSEPSDPTLRPGLPTGLSLGDALPLLFSAGRTGRLSAQAPDSPCMEVWVDQGRVTHAAWGPLRSLTALEMAALVPPHADFRFADGERAPNQSLDLSAVDVAARLAEVSRAGGTLGSAIPGIDAVPRATGHTPRAIDPDEARVLEQVDGKRSVADLTAGRQPLAVVRALATLVGEGVISFEAAPPPQPRMLARQVAAEAPVPALHEVDEPRSEAPPPRRRLQLDFRLLALALGLAVVLWLAVQRSQTNDNSGVIQVTLAPTGTAVVVAAAPTTQPAPVPPTALPATPVPPTAIPATAIPATAVPPTAIPATAAPPTPAPAASPAPLTDETFASGPAGWPNAATSTAFWDASGYHLVPRIAGQFAAITAPTPQTFTNGAVSALFRKVAGPDGGGYGLILRAQAPLDGSNQGGRYYVFEIGDRGEVGAWRREQNQWIDLQPWKSSEAVRSGIAENRLEVRAAGPQFTFSVNDTPVAEISDGTLPSGAVGVFTGGDGNQVLLERFTVTNQ